MALHKNHTMTTINIKFLPTVAHPPLQKSWIRPFFAPSPVKIWRRPWFIVLIFKKKSHLQFSLPLNNVFIISILNYRPILYTLYFVEVIFSRI